MAGIVKFYMGSGYATYMKDRDKENWAYKDALFFDTNTKKIYLNGETYTGSVSGEGMDETAAWAAFGWAFGAVKDSINNGAGTDEAYEFIFQDLSENEAGSIVIPKATEGKSGVMSSADKTKLNSINVDNIVYKETGKGLSSNDFTNELLNKVNAAQENVIEKILVDNAPLSINSNKAVNIELTKAIESVVGATVSGAYTYKGSVSAVSELPTNAQVGDVYNIEVETTEYGAAGVNVAWNGTSWDSLGGIFNIKSVSDKVNTNETNINDLQTRVKSLEDIGAELRLSELEKDIETITGDGEDSITYISQEIVNNALKWSIID